MNVRSDWLPSTREGQLAMAKNWQSVAGAKMGAWGIPQSVMDELGARIQAAESILADAKNETKRTPVVTAECKRVFEALVDTMRDMKRRFFLCPPLTEPDLVSLGLKPHDTKPTPSGKPTAQAMVETFLVGRYELGIRLVYVSGDPDDPANKGCRVHYAVVAPGEAPPDGPDDLHKSFFTHRKKDMILFAYGDSGKTAYIAVQVENNGLKGQWGPMIQAVIP